MTVVDTQNQDGSGTPPPDTSDNQDMEYFRTEIHGLKVELGPAQGPGEIAPDSVSFVPYWEEKLGVEGKFKVGYLATDDGTAIRKLNADINVTRISKAAYTKATTEKDDSEGNPIGAIRAPY